MSHKQEAGGGFELNTTPLMVGAALICAGAVIGLAGMVLSGTVMLSATRRWIRQMDVPPNELAKQKWQQARAATQAGASAWQDGVGAGSRRS